MIYTVGNTSVIGLRVDVFVNGNLVKYARSADTERGVVVYCPEPIRANKKGDAFYTRKLRGVVTVEEIERKDGKPFDKTE